MEFVRRNLFLVIVAVVTAVVGVILLIGSFSKSGLVDERQAPREKAAQDLKSLFHSKANLLTVKAEKRRVEAVQGRAKEIGNKIVEWNSNRFDMLKVPKRDDANKVEMVPAFPIDRELYGKYALGFEVTKKYIEELKALLKELEATRPPTDAEIKVEVDKARHRIKASGHRRVLDAERDDAAGRLGVPVAPVAPVAPMEPRGAIPGDGRIVIRAPRGEETRNVEDQAKVEGFETSVLFHSRAGVTYATLGSFDMVFPVERVGATDVELWRSFVNLLVQKDIVGAIRDTNNIALERDTPKPKRPRVSVAAVKRLVSVDVDENYYVRAGAAPILSRGRVSPRPGPGPGPGPGGPRGPEFEPGMPGPLERAGGTSSGETIGFTGRSTNRKFEVVHYKFTVIMPTRHLPLLMKNLQGRSYHTVLQTEIIQIGTKTTRSTARANDRAGDDRYYFGTDPVMQVTIYGEFVMLSDWTRGRWDPDKRVEGAGIRKKGAWSDKYPPLMPVDVLKVLYAKNSSVLRKRDLARMQKPRTTRR